MVSSNKDIASQNIKKQILAHYPFESATETFEDNSIYEANIERKQIKLVTLNRESVHAQNLQASFTDLELVIFISRHSSESGTPTLSVHTPGNLGEAELGGLSRMVSVSPANAMRDALKTMARLKEEKRLGYEVSYECTHHGPSLDVPTMFVELGSSAAQWSDVAAAEIVAHAAVDAAARFGEQRASAVLGIGGTHYNAKFTRVALEGEVAFGHMIPKYAVASVDVEVLRHCVERTLEKVECAVLDWKGIKGEHKPKLIDMLKEMNMPTQRV